MIIRAVAVAMLAVLVGIDASSNRSVAQEQFFEFPLSIEGMPLDEFFADKARAAEVLNEIEGINLPADNTRLSQLLQRIEEGYVPEAEVDPALRGLGGIGTWLALRAYLFDESFRVQGKIRDYVYVDADHSGHLAVEVKIQYFASAADRLSGKPPIKTVLFHWDIDVNGVYVVHQRGSDHDNPFPSVDLTLPAAAIASIWDPTRDLKYKLHAKGTSIVVHHVYRKIEGGAMTLLPSGDFRYTSTDESCIDLLFNPYPPEFDLPPQKGYCLGRCKHPFIVNTGG